MSNWPDETEWTDGQAEAATEALIAKEFIGKFGQHEFVPDALPRRRKEDNDPTLSWCQVCGVTKYGIEGLHF